MKRKTLTDEEVKHKYSELDWFIESQITQFTSGLVPRSGREAYEKEIRKLCFAVIKQTRDIENMRTIKF